MYMYKGCSRESSNSINDQPSISELFSNDKICFVADTAYAKNSKTGKWYNFDDSHVAECTEKSIVVSENTILHI